MDWMMVQQGLVALGIVAGLILLWLAFSWWARRHDERMKHIPGRRNDNLHEPTYTFHHDEMDFDADDD